MPLTRSNIRSSKNSDSGDIIEMLSEIKREPYVDLTINNKLFQNDSKSTSQVKTTKRQSSSPAKVKKTQQKLSKSITTVTSKRSASKSKSRSPSRRRPVATAAAKTTKRVITKRELNDAKKKTAATVVEQTIETIDASIIQTTSLKPASAISASPLPSASTTHKYSLRQRDTASQMRRMSPFNSIRFSSSTPLKSINQQIKAELKPSEQSLMCKYSGYLKYTNSSVCRILLVTLTFMLLFYYLCWSGRVSVDYEAISKYLHFDCIRNAFTGAVSHVRGLFNRN